MPAPPNIQILLMTTFTKVFVVLTAVSHVETVGVAVAGELILLQLHRLALQQEKCQFQFFSNVLRFFSTVLRFFSTMSGFSPVCWDFSPLCWDCYSLCWDYYSLCWDYSPQLLQCSHHPYQSSTAPPAIHPDDRCAGAHITFMQLPVRPDASTAAVAIRQSIKMVEGCHCQGRGAGIFSETPKSTTFPFPAGTYY